MHVCASENLELGCALVEKATVEKAIRTLTRISAAYDARRKARESGVAFIDKEALAKSSPQMQLCLRRFPSSQTFAGRCATASASDYEHFRIVRSGAGTQQPGAYSNLDAREQDG